MNDAALDREIESLLAVEPSPEFLARVRTRVAHEPEPRAWRVSWVLAMAGAAAAVAVAVMVWPSSDAIPSNTAPIEHLRGAEVAETIAPSNVPAPPAQVRTNARVVAVDVVAMPERAIDIDLPDVMIAENEARTFASLVADIRQQRFAAVVPAAPDPDAPLVITELPAVEPIEIEPIVKLAVLQTEGERP